MEVHRGKAASTTLSQEIRNLITVKTLGKQDVIMKLKLYCRCAIDAHGNSHLSLSASAQ